MSSTFGGFSEEDLKRIKSGEIVSNSGPIIDMTNVKKRNKIGTRRPKQAVPHYRLPVLQQQNSDEAIDDITFDKCKLSIKTPTSLDNDTFNDNDDKENIKDDEIADVNTYTGVNNEVKTESVENGNDTTVNSKKDNVDITPDIVRGVDNYTEDELTAHRAKLEELQLKQKLMEEQNKKRKEMLSKALADRTRQTEEEVMKLEKIKKELQVLDGQFSQDVGVLRKKIDQACLSYAEAEKHYLKVEKEFLQAKINLQKEKEKKELLTEHLCALITHNETRKAQKLETLMLELATDRKRITESAVTPVGDENPVIIDGVDQKTGKIVEFNAD